MNITENEEKTIYSDKKFLVPFMISNTIFHVHGPLCRHAGEEKEEAYVLKALELGAERIYFSDHCPFPGNPFRMRMLMEEYPMYLSYLRELKVKYADQIAIHIGVEAEYIPSFHNYYEMLKEELDFLLLGQHFSLLPDGSYTFQSREKIAEPRELADGMIQGMESGFFDAVAHPCQIYRRIKTWSVKEELLSACIKECAARTGVALEKNISNMLAKKKRRVYWPEFWDNMPKNVNTIYGLDAHSTKELEENFLIQQELIDKDIQKTGTELIEKHLEALRKLAD